MSLSLKRKQKQKQTKRVNIYKVKHKADMRSMFREIGIGMI